MGDEMHNQTLQEVLDVETYMEEIKTVDYIPKRSANAGARFICPYGCSKLIALRTIDYHKNNGCGRQTNDSLNAHPDLKKRYYCCGVCYAEFVTRIEFHAHLKFDHDVHPEVHQLSFKDRQLFDRFVRWIEQEGGAHFRHKSGAKRRGRGKGIFMACNRSGYVNSAAEKIKPDRTGPFRLGYSCCAYIHATEHDDGTVSAEVCCDHYGHDARMRLPNIIKYIIAHKQLDGEQPQEIIGYLRRHFMNFSHENIYAQRICFVDIEELKAIYSASTKRWEQAGIPQKCEVWEEELLDQAGIVREGVPRLREYTEKTTSQLANDENWPRPRVFVAKIRSNEGVLVPLEVRNEMLQQTMQDPAEYDAVHNHQHHNESQYVDIEMDEYVEESYEHQNYAGDDRKVQRTEDVFEPNNGQLLDEDEVEVEAETEVETSSTVQQQLLNRDEDDLLVQSPSHEVVIVDDMKMSGMNLHQQAGPSEKCVVETLPQSYYDSTVDRLLDEIERFKLTILKKGDTVSPANLRSILVRFQSLHNSILDKQPTDGNMAVPIFPNSARMTYRPGKGLEKPDTQYMNLRGGDVTLLPIEDEMSDDEGLAENTVLFNSNIWS
ncbi:unnamed protein product [Caenorhabditis angaria]|uniref:C2H2-type domain-containing protein n=1 Tax=Caenorhabditis angaria TaxID=860376 RepID=A0A9P1N5D7_9PELO|nr:unnamed protein product [Caenorhabditis angaria]